MNNKSPWFPDPSLATPEGLLAIGGSLSVPWLELAYSRGIFPWYGPDTPILWWSPDPRMVLFPDNLHVSRSLKKVLNREEFAFTFNMHFDEVLESCATAPRQTGNGTWLVPEMVEAYKKFHRAGFAVSFECWSGNELAGGLYGVLMGSVFFGESMFHRKSNASKFAFVHAVRFLAEKGVEVIDCQQKTSHLASLGAAQISRADFSKILDRSVSV